MGCRQMDEPTDSPCILQDIVPSGSLRGRCPAYLTAAMIKCYSRARVPMTILGLLEAGPGLQMASASLLEASESSDQAFKSHV